MAKIRFLRRLAGFNLTQRTKAGLVTGGALTGGIVNALSASPGDKAPAFREGIFKGLLIGAGVAFSPAIIRVSARAIKSEAKLAAKVVSKRGKIVFRRIRGRIIPIRVKK